MKKLSRITQKAPEKAIRLFTVLLISLIFFSKETRAQGEVVEATENEYISVVVTIAPSKLHKNDLGYTQLQLGFKKLVFDNNGKIISAEGLNPKITHLLNNDLIALPADKLIANNGIIVVRLEGGHKLLLPIDDSRQITIHNADFLLTRR